MPKNIVSVRGLLVQALLAALVGAGLGLTTVAGLGTHLALGSAGGGFLGVTALLLFRMITAPAGSSGGTAAFQALAKVAILGGLIGTTTGVFLFFPLSELTNKAVGELCIPAGGILGVTVASFLWAVAHLLVPPPGPSSLGPTAPADDPEPTARGLPFLQPEPRKTDQVFRADRHTGADE